MKQCHHCTKIAAWGVSLYHFMSRLDGPAYRRVINMKTTGKVRRCAGECIHRICEVADSMQAQRHLPKDALVAARATTTPRTVIGEEVALLMYLRKLALCDAEAMPPGMGRLSEHNYLKILSSRFSKTEGGQPVAYLDDKLPIRTTRTRHPFQQRGDILSGNIRQLPGPVYGPDGGLLLEGLYCPRSGGGPFNIVRLDVCSTSSG